MSEQSDARARAERNAIALLGIGSLTMAIICGAIIVSGWFAGVIDDGPERWFWGGAILEFVMVAVFAAAAYPGGADDIRTTRRIMLLTRIGLVLFVLAPAICVGALIVDFYR